MYIYTLSQKFHSREFILYKYFYKKEKLTHNAPSLVDLPTIRDKAIIRLEPNEVADLLDVVQNGDGLTEKQKAYHNKTQKRDLAILTLFLGTGIRTNSSIYITYSVYAR